MRNVVVLNPGSAPHDVPGRGATGTRATVGRTEVAAWSLADEIAFGRGNLLAVFQLRTGNFGRELDFPERRVDHACS